MEEKLETDMQWFPADYTPEKCDLREWKIYRSKGTVRRKKPKVSRNEQVSETQENLIVFISQSDLFVNYKCTSKLQTC